MPFFMLLLQFTVLASEDVNVRLLLIYPAVDSTHGRASAFFGGVCEKILGVFHQSPHMQCCEIRELNSYKKENIAFRNTE